MKVRKKNDIGQICFSVIRVVNIILKLQVTRTEYINCKFQILKMQNNVQR